METLDGNTPDIVCKMFFFAIYPNQNGKRIRRNDLCKLQAYGLLQRRRYSVLQIEDNSIRFESWRFFNEIQTIARHIERNQGIFHMFLLNDIFFFQFGHILGTYSKRIEYQFIVGPQFTTQILDGSWRSAQLRENSLHPPGPAILVRLFNDHFPRYGMGIMQYVFDVIDRPNRYTIVT